MNKLFDWAKSLFAITHFNCGTVADEIDCTWIDKDGNLHCEVWYNLNDFLNWQTQDELDIDLIDSVYSVRDYDKICSPY